MKLIKIQNKIINRDINHLHESWKDTDLKCLTVTKNWRKISLLSTLQYIKT